MAVAGSMSLLSCVNTSSGSENAPADELVAGQRTEVQVEAVWDLPAELDELSGQVRIDEDRMAVVQDNEGIIYFYNLKSKQVESQVRFSGSGDYEGITKVGETYYVLRSDGLLSEVQLKGKQEPAVKTYELPFSTKNDMETVVYDEKNARLLIGTKEKGLTPGEDNGVYAFDLKSKKLNTDAIFTLGGGDGEVKSAEGNGDGKKGKKKDGKKDKNQIKPSDMAIHPVTGEYYILNGPRSELVIADTAGRITSRRQLDKKQFPQPEGISFTRDGELYISSEKAKNANAIIARVKL